MDTLTLQNLCKLHPLQTKFGYGIQQTWSALYLLNELLIQEPSITRIVEIGSLTGGLSLLFGMSLRERKGRVLSLDIQNPVKDIQLAAQNFGVEFKRINVFSKEAQDEVKEFTKDHRSLIFCDGGSKKDELVIYSKIIKPNDIIMAHDLLTEVFITDLPDEILLDLELFHQEIFNKFKTYILSFRKSSSPDPKNILDIRANIYRGWGEYAET